MSVRCGLVAVVLALPMSAYAQDGPFTISAEVIPGQVINGGSRVNVEFFIRNDGADFLIKGYQIDVPCLLIAKAGATGMVNAHPSSVNGVPALGRKCLSNADCPPGITCNTAPNPNVCNSTSIGNFSAVASGTVCWVYHNDAACAPNDGLQGGTKALSQGPCRFGGAPGAGEPSYTLPAGAKRYAGTIAFEVSECAAGTHNMPYEQQTMPNCQNIDLTRITGDDNNCRNFTPVAGAITVPTGSCCDCGTCVSDHVNQACCLNELDGRTWSAGRDCTTPCELDSDECCDDGQFCNGTETLNLATGQCVIGTPPVCPGGSDCRNAFCDPAANGGAGACRLQNRPDGTACGNPANTPCSPVGTCFNGTCQLQAAPAGTPCGDPADTVCDNPDSCDGGGLCRLNHVPNDTPCPDTDTCTTLERCQEGTCVFDVVDCDDGLFCNGAETCDPAGGCVPGDLPCAEGELCDEVGEGCGSLTTIPTASAWGLVILALAVLAASKALFARRRRSFGASGL